MGQEAYIIWYLQLTLPGGSSQQRFHTGQAKGEIIPKGQA